METHLIVYHILTVLLGLYGFITTITSTNAFVKIVLSLLFKIAGLYSMIYGTLQLFKAWGII